MVEPDGGGETFREKLSACAGVRERLRFVELGEAKDPSALHLVGPDRFLNNLRAAFGRAKPWTYEVRAEAEAHARDRQAEERLLYSGLWKDQDLVFPNKTGSPMDWDNITARSYKPLREKAGLPETTRFYDLRHSCATLLLSKNVHAKVVQELLGHATITQTMDTYSHVLPTMQDAATEAMESALS